MALKNRIVMAPMTRSFAVGGLPDASHAAYYRRRAEGQVGLILSEGTVIERMERGEFDLIAVGRALIADPDWAVKVRGGNRAGLMGFETAMLREFV